MSEFLYQPTVITVQQQLDFLEPQYVRTIVWCAALLVAYALWGCYTAVRPEKLAFDRENITYFSHTVGFIAASYLLVISAYYFGWLT